MSETFSRENVNYMKRLKINNSKERYVYLRIAMFCKSSVKELKEIINKNIYNLI